jgi:hypothetical protein
LAFVYWKAMAFVFGGLRQQGGHLAELPGGIDVEGRN